MSAQRMMMMRSLRYVLKSDSRRRHGSAWPWGSPNSTSAWPGWALPAVIRWAITSSRMGHLWDTLSRAYDVLGLQVAAGGDEVFQALVLARIIEPTSKLAPAWST